ncbi:replicase polyprotein [Macrobrachium rosenbergii dicistrovirus 2]|nr:replicase polyprotein [Macrobrachium rosenbergii dicistrovirus 2]
MATTTRFSERSVCELSDYEQFVQLFRHYDMTKMPREHELAREYMRLAIPHMQDVKLIKRKEEEEFVQTAFISKYGEVIFAIKDDSDVEITWMSPFYIVPPNVDYLKFFQNSREMCAIIEWPWDEMLQAIQQHKKSKLRSKLEELAALREKSVRECRVKLGLNKIRRFFQVRENVSDSTHTESTAKTGMESYGDIMNELVDVAQHHLHQIRKTEYHAKARFQGSFAKFQGLFSTSDRVSSLLTNIEEVTKEVSGSYPVLFESITGTCDVISEAGSTINKLAARVESTISNLTDPKVMGFALVIIMLMLVFSSSKKIKYLGFFIITMRILGWDRKLVDAIVDKFSATKFQNFADSTLASVGFMIFYFVFLGMVPQRSIIDDFLRRLATLPKAASGVKEVWENSANILREVETQFQYYFLGKKRPQLSAAQKLIQEVNEWSLRVEEINSMPSLDLLAKDKDLVAEVETLYRQMNVWLHDPIVRTSFPNNELFKIVLSIRPTMNELYRRATSSNVHTGGPRKSPLTVMFSGVSGCGKSELVMPIALNMLSMTGNSTKNFKNEIYIRNCETEFWDGYAHQKICIVDDAFQLRDTVSKPSPEFMESIRLANTMPTQLHCADLRDKGKFFTSEILIYTSNITHNLQGFIESIICKEAALRRLDVNAYRVSTHKDYTRIVMVNGLPESRLDTSKIGWSREREESGQPFCQRCKAKAEELNEDLIFFCAHHYEFQKYNVMTDENIGRPITYVELREQLRQHYVRKDREETNKLASYEKMASDPAYFQGSYEKRELEDIEEGEEVFADCSEGVTLGQWINQYWLKTRNATNEAMEAILVQYNHIWDKYISGDFGTIIPNISGKKIEISTAFARLKEMAKSCWESVTSFLRTHFASISMVLSSLIFAFEVYKFFQEPTTEMTNPIVLRSGNKIIGLIDYDAIWDLPSIKFESKMEDGKIYMDESDKGRRIFESSSSSGEYKPKMKKKKFESEDRSLFELSSSADNKLHTTKKKFESPTFSLNEFEVSSSADNKLYTPKKKFEGHSDAVSAALGRSMMEKSQYFAAIWKPKTTRELVNLGQVLFVKGTTFLMNNHFFEHMKHGVAENIYEEDDLLVFSNYVGEGIIQAPLSEILKSYQQLKYPDGDVAEAGLVTLSSKNSKVHPHRDLTNNFINKADLGNIKRANGQLQTWSTYGNRYIHTHKILYEIEGVFDQSKSFEVDNEWSTYHYRKYWKYCSKTFDGDCGAPVIMDDPSAQRKILGVHSAGGPDLGYATVITKQMLDEYFNTKFQCYPVFPECAPINTLEIDQVGDLPTKDGLVVLGKTEKKVVGAVKTKIIPSALQGKLGETRTRPALLHKQGDLNPMENGVKKFGKNVPFIESGLIETASKDVMNNLELNVKRLDKTKYARVLTYEESLLGSEDDEFLAPINRGTSLGYPYVIDWDHPRGKRDAFGDDEWTMDTEQAKVIKHNTEQLIADCREGIQRNVIWTDTLKDERRTHEKVDAGKTRVFTAGPVHFTLAFRQYFLGFAAWIMQNRIHNEIATGTNVYSNDWEEIAKLLLSQGGKNAKLLAGDFSNFDGSLNAQILWTILDMINDWYNDGEENARIRKTLWMSIVHAIHLNGEYFWQATHSQPSGCPITAILNSIYHCIVIRIVYLIIMSEMKPEFATMAHFRKFIRAIVYGDDDVISVADEIIEFFNMINITEAFKVIGHVYTDETKKEASRPFKYLEEVNFLKRGFIYDPLVGRHLAPLDINVITEIPQWTKKGVHRHAITEANIDVTMRELSLHSKEIFNEKAKMVERVSRECGYNINFHTQREYKQLVLNSIYLI